MAARSSKTENARLQQAIYKKALRLADKEIREKYKDEHTFLLLKYQVELEIEAGYEPAPRGNNQWKKVTP